MSPTILITGATGFVGSRVVNAARNLPEPPRLRLLQHRRPAAAAASGLYIVTADLAEPQTLRGVCDGVDAVIHCASQVGGSAETCEAVNADGTAALVAQARRAGVGRIVYLSTAAVYGRGPFRHARVNDLARSPVSATSRTRAAAEDAVLDAGGTVLRPHLVYGAGDRWVVRGVAALLQAVPFTVDGWTATTSMIDADSLGRVLLQTATAPSGALASSIYHANHPDPVASSELLQAVAALIGHPWPTSDLSYARARDLLIGQGSSTKALDMLATDHWFHSTDLWADLGYDPGPRFQDRFATYAERYRRALTADLVGNPVPS